jgi:hypothetical protein
MADSVGILKQIGKNHLKTWLLASLGNIDLRFSVVRTQQILATSPDRDRTAAARLIGLPCPSAHNPIDATCLGLEFYRYAKRPKIELRSKP